MLSLELSGDPMTPTQATEMRTIVMRAAQVGGLAKAVAESGEGNVPDVLGELILAALRLNMAGAGVAIARQASATDRELMVTSKSQEFVASQGYGITWNAWTAIFTAADKPLVPTSPPAPPLKLTTRRSWLARAWHSWWIPITVGAVGVVAVSGGAIFIVKHQRRRRTAAAAAATPILAGARTRRR